MWSHLFPQGPPLNVHKSFLPAPPKCFTGSLLEYLPHTSAIKEKDWAPSRNESLLSGGKTGAFSLLLMVAALGIFWLCDGARTEHGQ